ncbi:50S ribosomal protein L13 [Halanaerobaculum tunisiense]
MSTYMPSPEDIERNWYVVDLADKTLGRATTEIAKVLQGKHKPTYTPHMDTGDFVIVVNAAEVHLTGNKLEQKQYRKHSDYPGGLKETAYDELLKDAPEKAIKKAVKGMLPSTKLGRKMIKKLKVYAGAEHPHQAQEPTELEL